MSYTCSVFVSILADILDERVSLSDWCHSQAACNAYEFVSNSSLNGLLVD